MPWKPWVSILIVLFAAVMLLRGCGHSSPPPKSNKWRTDTEPVARRMPLISSIDLCIWRTGKATNYSGGRLSLPAPEEYYIEGFIQLTGSQVQTIQEKYKWKDAPVNIVEIPSPSPSDLRDKFAAGKKYSVSDEFMQEHAQRSSYPQCKFILNAESCVLYFYLQSI